MLNETSKLIWLASYPKSGNTWVRLFLSALLYDADNFDINNPGLNLIISARSIIDSALGVSSANFPERDYLPYRSELYNRWADNYTMEKYLLCKVHDACTLNHVTLFPPAITKGTIYILRNPFDMAASMANHHNVPIETAVEMLCDPQHGLDKKQTRLNSQISQHLGTWSSHVQSWVNVHQDNMLLVKYENLVNHPLIEFSKIVKYIELDYSQIDIKKALQKTSFNTLQNKEKVTKFKMAPKVKTFFRQGKSGQWRNEITQAQAQQIIDVNYESLLKYNYIDSNGNILV